VRESRARSIIKICQSCNKESSRLGTLNEEQGSFLLQTFLSGFLAGLFSKIGADALFDWWKDRVERSAFRKAFRSEIVVATENLERNRLEFLPHAVWDSAAYSGALRLFTADQRIRLSRVYFGVSNFNYEATRCRDLGEDSRREPPGERKNLIDAAWKRATENTKAMGNNFLKTLRKLLDEDWLKV